LHVRTSGGAGPLIPSIRRRIAALDPSIVVFDAMTIEQHLSAALSPIRLASIMLGLFGSSGLRSRSLACTA
jgi:hypothetical protein